MYLKEKIKEAGLRHSKVAELLGVHYVTLSNWVNGARPIPEEREREIEKICENAKKKLK